MKCYEMIAVGLMLVEHHLLLKAGQLCLVSSYSQMHRAVMKTNFGNWLNVLDL